MKKVTSFSDKFLIKAAADYAYQMSHFELYADPVFSMKLAVKLDFNNRYQPIIVENISVIRNEETLALRYILFQDKKTNEYALIYQGSDYDYEAILSGEDKDWSYNFSNLAHLPLENYEYAKAEFKYLKEERGYNITAVSGNSLGGGYALNLAKDYPNIRIIGLNPAPNSFGKKYANSENATILLSNTDLLSRLILLDYKRIDDDLNKIINMEKTIKLKNIYGFLPIIEKRSIYYMNVLNIKVGHVGALIDYRELSKNILLDNMVFYSSKMALNNKSLIDLSKYLIKLPLNSFENDEYSDFLDNYVYPNLVDYAKKRVDNYKKYPSLDEFMLFDNNTLEIIDQEGRNFNNEYIIDDKRMFVDSVFNNLEDFKNTSNFILTDNKYLLLESLFDDEKNMYNKSFFTLNFNMNTNFDLSVLKQLTYIPISAIVKLSMLVDQNRKILRQLLSTLNNEYFNLNPKFNDKKVNNTYSNIYLHLNSDLEALNQLIVENLNITLKNIEYIIISLNIDDNIDNCQLESIKYIDILAYLSKYLNYDNLIDKQFNNVFEYVVKYSIILEEKLDDIINLSDDIIASMISKYSSINDDNKLSKQLKNIEQQLDFKGFLTLLFNDFKYDFTAFLLRESVAMYLKNNFKQFEEVNNNLCRLILNLKYYLFANFKEKHIETIIEDLDMILIDIKLLNSLLSKLF